MRCSMCWSDGCEKHLCFILDVLKDQNPFNSDELL